MCTPNSFAAALKKERKARGMTMRKFAKMLDISLSSLIEYESGRRLPRAGTVKHIAQKLHTSPAALVSDLPADGQSLHSCFEYISRYIQSLHPNTRASAKHALDMLLLAVKTSENLFFMENHAAPPEDPSAQFRYTLHETPSSPTPYGILVEELRDGAWSAAAAFAPFSNDRLAVLNIVYSANELQLPPDKFFSDVFPDFPI